MEIENDLKLEVSELIFWEATLLDRRRWEEWIELYTEDAVFWVPSWVDEENTTDDPETQLNLMYFRSRSGIEDRVFRIESRDSYASLPLDRTVHLVGNVLIDKVIGNEVYVFANCLVHTFGKNGAQTRASMYDYIIRQGDNGLKIAHKKITFVDDKLEGPVDVYHL